MYDEIRSRKINFGVNWVKAPGSGNTYLCPIGVDVANATENELRTLCVVESNNPQND